MMTIEERRLLAGTLEEIKGLIHMLLNSHSHIIPEEDSVGSPSMFVEVSFKHLNQLYESLSEETTLRKDDGDQHV